MQKAVWITLAVAVVLVNAFAEGIDYYAGIEIIMFYRIVMIFSFTAVASIFVGAMVLIHSLEEEKPLSGHVSNTLGPDRKVKEKVEPVNRSRLPADRNKYAATTNSTNNPVDSKPG